MRKQEAKVNIDAKQRICLARGILTAPPPLLMANDRQFEQAGRKVWHHRSTLEAALFRLYD